MRGVDLDDRARRAHGHPRRRTAPARACCCALLHGLLAPTRGAVAGAARRRGAARQAMVFQRPVLLRRSALANVRYALRLAGVPRRERASAHREALARGRPRRASRARPRACSPAASSSGSRWRAPGRCSPRCCSSTSRRRASIPARRAKSKRSSAAFARARHEDRDGDAQPRAGASAWRDEILFLHAGTLDRARPPADDFFNAAAPRPRRRHFWKENCHGECARACRCRHVLALCAFARRAAQERFITVASTTSTEQSGLFEHLLPIFEKKTGIKVRVVALGTGQALDIGAARRCRRGLRARQGGRGEIPRRRARREALPGHVQRLRADRPEGRPRASRGRQGHPRRAEENRGRAGAVRVARRQERHARSGAALVEGRRHRHRRRRRARGIATPGSGMGPTLNTAAVDERLHAGRPRHLALFQEPRRPGDPGRRRQASVQPVRRDAGESGEASAREEGARASSSSTGWFRREGRTAIAGYKIDGEQLFFPNAGTDA